jgi:hypothetical protein
VTKVLGSRGIIGDYRVKFFADLLGKKLGCNLTRSRGEYIRGVEVGIDHGRFLFPLVNALGWRVDVFYGVDPFRKFTSYRAYWTKEHWDELYYKVLQVSSTFAENVLIARMTSEEAACVLPDDFNFVYIDGAHDYYSVLTDISLWEEKIVPGGILAGHDYVSKKKYAAVGKAVDHYAKEMGRELINFKGNWYWKCGVRKYAKRNGNAQDEI